VLVPIGELNDILRLLIAFQDEEKTGVKHGQCQPFYLYANPIVVTAATEKGCSKQEQKKRRQNFLSYVHIVLICFFVSPIGFGHFHDLF
jgi:hypothetical protein